MISGVPRNEDTSRAWAKSRFGSYGSWSTVAEDHRTVARASWTNVERCSSSETWTCPTSAPIVRAAADRPAVGQHVRDRVDEQDEGPIERQTVDDGIEGAIEQLVEIEGRAESAAELVQGRQLAEAALELDARQRRLRGLA